MLLMNQLPPRQRVIIVSVFTEVNKHSPLIKFYKTLNSLKRFNIKNMVESNGVEPLTPCVQSRCSTN